MWSRQHVCSVVLGFVLGVAVTVILSGPGEPCGVNTHRSPPPDCVHERRELPPTHVPSDAATPLPRKNPTTVGGIPNAFDAAVRRAPFHARFDPIGVKVQRAVKALVDRFGERQLTDKFTIHDYGVMYESALERYAGDLWKADGAAGDATSFPPFTMLEIGLGCIPGYFNLPGLGYRFFKHYAPNVDYYGLDINPCNFSHLGPSDAAYLDGRIAQASQTDTAALRNVTDRWGPFDIIVDDGSHQSAHIIGSWMWLFEHALRPGGSYCIEDFSAAYMPMAGHPRTAQAQRLTSVNFLHNLISQMHFPFHMKRSATGWDKPLPLFFDPYVHPAAAFPITRLARWIRRVDCDREICCIHKTEALHRFEVPCDADVCGFPPSFLKG